MSNLRDRYKLDPIDELLKDIDMSKPANRKLVKMYLESLHTIAELEKHKAVLDNTNGELRESLSKLVVVLSGMTKSINNIGSTVDEVNSKIGDVWGRDTLAVLLADIRDSL